MYKEQILRIIVIVKGKAEELPYDLAEALSIGEKIGWDWNWNLKRLKMLGMDEKGKEKQRALEKIFGVEAPFGPVVYIVETLDGKKIKLWNAEACALFIGEKTNGDYNEIGKFGIAIPKRAAGRIRNYFSENEKNSGKPPTGSFATELAPLPPPRAVIAVGRRSTRGREITETEKKVEKVANDTKLNYVLRTEARRALLVLKYDTDAGKVKKVEAEWEKWLEKGGHEKAIEEEREFQLNRSQFFKKITPLERKKAIWAQKRLKAEREALEKEEAKLKQKQNEEIQKEEEKTRKEQERARKRAEEQAREMELRKEWLDKKLRSFLKEQRRREKDRSYGIDAIHLARGTEDEKERARKKYDWKIKEWKKEKGWE